LPGEIFGLPGQSIRVAFGQQWTANVNAQLSQVLFNQSVFTGLKAAKSTKEFYLLNEQLTEEDIIRNVAVAYYQVYQSQKMLENLDSNLKLTRETIEIVKGLFDNGLARKIDFDRSTVALNNITANRQQLINAVQLSENALKFMIGMPMEIRITLPDETFAPAFIPQEGNFLADRTEIQLMNKQLELLEWRKKATQAEYYPSAALVANYGYLGQGPEIPLWNGEDKGVFWSDFSAIGVNVQIPIFSGFDIRSRVRQNKIEIENAEADLRETQLAVQLDHSKAPAQFENSRITIDNQEVNVKLAEEVLADTHNNYSRGLASLNDMLDAERDLSNARNNLTTAQLDYKLAEIEFLRSQGKLGTLNTNTL